jgi:hypothetical protein
MLTFKQPRRIRYSIGEHSYQIFLKMESSQNSDSLDSDYLENLLNDFGVETDVLEFLNDSLVEQVLDHIENDYIQDECDQECFEELDCIEKEEEKKWDQLCAIEVDKIDKVKVFVYFCILQVNNVYIFLKVDSSHPR